MQVRSVYLLQLKTTPDGDFPARGCFYFPIALTRIQVPTYTKRATLGCVAGWLIISTHRKTVLKSEIYDSQVCAQELFEWILPGTSPVARQSVHRRLDCGSLSRRATSQPRLHQDRLGCCARFKGALPFNAPLLANSAACTWTGPGGYLLWPAYQRKHTGVPPRAVINTLTT